MRYDLGAEDVEVICKAMGLSRRQFFRDHRTALERLIALMLPSVRSGEEDTVDGPCVASGVIAASDGFQHPQRSLANGFRNTGAYSEAMEVLSRIFEQTNSSRAQVESALDICEIAAECGDYGRVRQSLNSAKEIVARAPSAIPLRFEARFAIIEGHLAPSHLHREEWYERGVAILAQASKYSTCEADEAPLVATALHALSLSHDHRGDWLAARKAANRCLAVLDSYQLAGTPIGLLGQANHAMRDARQFGNFDAAPEVLRRCLAVSLRNGWVQVTGDIAVHFINLNLMRSRYAQALAWHRWISAIDASHLGVRTRNFLAVDSAHALTMLGHPNRALVMLKAGGDEGLAFVGAREYWRGEALQAAGESERALPLALRALDGAVLACSEKGRARSKRLIASCHQALGHTRTARKVIAECLELSERYASPYDLLLSLSVATKIDRQNARNEAELARLLRGSASDTEYGPPISP